MNDSEYKKYGVACVSIIRLSILILADIGVINTLGTE